MQKREVGKRIKAIRHTMTQAEFASILDVTQSMVSAWESGREAPSTGNWLKIASLTGDADADWCWKQAGLDYRALAQKEIERIMREKKERLEDAGSPEHIDQIELIRRVRQTPQGLEPAGPSLLMPAEAISNPLSTYCFVFEEYEAVVDTTDAGAGNVLPFLGKLVLARFAPKAERENYPWPEGFFVGVLDWPEEHMTLGKIEWILRFLPLAYTPPSRTGIIVGLWTEREFETPATEAPIATREDFEAAFIKDARRAFPRQEGESEEDWVARAVKLETEKRESPEALIAAGASFMDGFLEGRKIWQGRMQRAAREMRIPRGCEIAGRVIAQFPRPKASEGDR